MTRAEQFGRFFTEAARDAGLDFDSPRGGGITQVAEALGVSKSTVGRWRDGKAVPDSEYYEPLARLLGLRTLEFLARSGIFSTEVLNEIGDPGLRLRPITPTQALDELDIRDPDDRVAIRAVIEAAQRRQQRQDDQGKRGGAAAQ